MKLENSERHLKRALKTIPLAAQTFSKCHTQFSVGAAPLFLDKAKNGHVWDIDGNEYVDQILSLAPIVLGYQYEAVDEAVIAQLRKASTLSLPGTLEAELAEKICSLVPSAEMVRYGKNGSDATSGAVRAARAFTGRDFVACAAGRPAAQLRQRGFELLIVLVRRAELIERLAGVVRLDDGRQHQGRIGRALRQRDVGLSHLTMRNASGLQVARIGQHSLREGQFGLR